MVSWATGVVEFIPGLLDPDDPSQGSVGTGGTSFVLGPPGVFGDDLKPLGSTGQIVLEFADLIHDGPGDDFAVFENGFFSVAGCFCELGFVAVSTDGITFSEFPSETTSTSPEFFDPTDYHNFAGKHPKTNLDPFIGTGFDLEELSTHPLVISGDVNLGEIRFVRITDIVGDGREVDSLGNPILDPMSVNGFDLDAVGVIHAPEPGFRLMLALGVLWTSAFKSHRRSKKDSFERPRAART